MHKEKTQVRPPARPPIGLGIGVTGHRCGHPAFNGNAKRISAVVDAIFESIDDKMSTLRGELDEFEFAPPLLTTLMADGADQIASELALERGWKLASPLPFGRKLNTAINALPNNGADARALLNGDQPEDAQTQNQAKQIEELTTKAAIFDLADRDEKITQLFLAMLDDPQDVGKAQAFALESATRATLAGRIVISQSDILIGIWDGVSTANPGGTGHTIATALEMGEPVIWIDPSDPENWTFLYAPESLATLSDHGKGKDRDATLDQILDGLLTPDAQLRDPSRAKRGLAALYDAEWKDKSPTHIHAYRKIETIFGGEPRPFRSVSQTYERPEDIANGSARNLMEAAARLPDADTDYVEQVEKHSLQNFAWADGLSSRLSDRYRGGMIVNFLLSSIAIVGGILYLPLVDPEFKWPFALFEFLVLLAIVVITWRGVRFRWHGRWFETRRVAEYFRHTPFLLLLGMAHAPGRSPKGADTSWPEWIVRHTVRHIGLPHSTITNDYLVSYLDLLLDCHVRPQRDYHRQKAKRLRTVHHNLDQFSELLFKLAIISVAFYLILKIGVYFDLLDAAGVLATSKTFTVLGVMFPTLGGAIAGIRFFGDFERFAAISEVTSERLDDISQRIELLQRAPKSEICYARVVELAIATEDIVVSEIENWQAVFRGKQITVPV